MKKNILTVVILALGAINLVLSAVIIFTMVPAFSKVNSLISQVSSIIDLDKESPKVGSNGTVSFEDTIPYNMEDSALTINLKTNGIDTKPHYAILDMITLTLNTKGDGYSKYKDKMGDYNTLISEYVRDEFTSYTFDEVSSNDVKDQIKKDIIQKIEESTGLGFIVDISFKNFRLQ